MCGIVGWAGRLETSVEDPLGAGLAALATRGPDGSGRTRGRLGEHDVQFGVTQLRLAAPDERQPIRTAAGALLVFNGEIYNHAALRSGLRRRGHEPVDAGDAAVLAALLEVEGIEGLSRIEGSYAFVFLDPAAGTLLLGRDPLGVRPLAFALRPGAILFASTLDALVATGAVPAQPDTEAIVDVLRDGVVPSRRTALLCVRRVAPGEILQVDRLLHLDTTVLPRSDDAGADDESSGDVLEALRAAVTDRLGSARATGVFLSGGVDSALIAALARERADVEAFTLVFPGHTAVDERRRAHHTATRLGLVHVEVPCPRDPTGWVKATARAFDEPFADASAVPTWGLALAASQRIRIALTGTGGDEVFGGYRRYWMLGAGPWLRHIPAFVRAPLSRVFDRSLPAGARLLRASGDVEGLYRGLLRLQDASGLDALLGPQLRRASPLSARPGPQSAAEAMADDMEAYLPDDLLVKEDRALMAHGVEGRHPFLDRRVRRAARGVELKGGPGRGRQKQVLRAFVREVIDPDLARVPKRGFAFPVDDLYRGVLQELAGDLFSSQAFRERGFVVPHAAMRLLQDHARGTRSVGAVLHALVMLELWARRFLDAPTPAAGA